MNIQPATNQKRRDEWLSYIAERKSESIRRNAKGERIRGQVSSLLSQGYQIFSNVGWSRNGMFRLIAFRCAYVRIMPLAVLSQANLPPLASCRIMEPPAKRRRTGLWVSPVRRTGSKSNGRAFLMNAIKHSFPDAEIMVAPFFGGGHVEVRAAHCGLIVEANDLDKPLMNFWTELQEDQQALAESCKALLERGTLDLRKLRRRSAKSGRKGAAAFLVHCRHTCFGQKDYAMTMKCQRDTHAGNGYPFCQTSPKSWSLRPAAATNAD